VKSTFFIVSILALLSFAYFSAQQKLQTSVDVSALKLGMSAKELKKTFGTPSATDRNRLTFIFDDSSELIVTLRDKVVSSAQLKYHGPLKIEDPQLKQLTLVQMESHILDVDQPSWFFAGKPEEGLVYKITSSGLVESITWVPPFTYANHQPKQLKALLRDFHSQHWSKI